MSCNLWFLFWGALLWQLFVWFVKAVIAQHKAQNQAAQNAVKVEVVDEREVFFEKLLYENEILKKQLYAKETAFKQLSDTWANQTSLSEPCPECSNFYRQFEGREYRNVWRYVMAMEKYRDALLDDYNALVDYTEELEKGFENAIGALPENLERD